jgi:hypothetical protein
MRHSPPYPGPERALGLSVRRLTVALGELREAALAGDLKDLLAATNALEEATSEVASLAARLDPEATDHSGASRVQLTPAQSQFLADLVELKQEHERTRTLLLQAIEVTKGQYERLCRRVRPDTTYLPANAIPPILGRAIAE